MTRITALFLSTVLAAALQARADIKAPAASQPVRSSVDAVAAEVEVLVLDSKGKPVEGLTRSDFRLLVDGKETPIDWLEGPKVSSEPAPADGSAAAAAATAGRLHSTVFVVSDLHTDLRSRNEGLAALRSYVNALPPGEPAAVYLLDNGVRRLQAFTTDRAALSKALEKPAHMLPRSYTFSDTAGSEWVGQSRQMLRNFTTVLDSLASRPEAKTVVVLTGTIPPTGFVRLVGAGSITVPPGALSAGPPGGGPVAARPNTLYTSYSGLGLWDFLGEAKDVESQALLARATIVAIDPTGVVTRGGQAGRAFRGGSAVSGTWDFKNDTFALIAESTGGARLGYSNNPTALLAEEAQLLDARYRLGFTPPDATSVRRSIRVGVARPDVVVQTAAGQRSLTPESAARARFAALLLSADPPTGDFRIVLETKGSIQKRTDDAFPFDVLVPVSGVYAEEGADGKRAKLELLIAGVDPEGRTSDPIVMPFSVTLDRSAADGTFFRKNTNFKLDRKWKGRLFVGVRDTSTNRLGAVALPIGM